MSRQAHRLAGGILSHAGDLIDYAAGLDHADPPLHRALAGPLTHLQRLLGNRLVREYANPQLAASAHVAGDRPPSGLDLPGRHPARSQRLQTEVAERNVAAGCRLAAHAAAHHLAELRALRL